jgi:hypothetical protein
LIEVVLADVSAEDFSVSELAFDVPEVMCPSKGGAGSI